MGDDPFLKQAWNTIARILGIGGPYGDVKIGDIQVKPPPLPKHPDADNRLFWDQTMQNLRDINKPGTKVVDFLPAKEMTPEEHNKMREEYRRQGRTYRYEWETAVPPLNDDELILPPLRGRKPGR